MLIRGETVSGHGRGIRRIGRSRPRGAPGWCARGRAGGGGDKRGRQCAALLVVDREAYPLWDLRADEHPEPVAELRRIFEIAKLDLLPFVQGLPTRENPMGSLTDEFVEMNMLPPPERPGGGGAAPREPVEDRA